jgi:hypothetical protein
MSENIEKYKDRVSKNPKIKSSNITTKNEESQQEIE